MDPAVAIVVAAAVSTAGVAVILAAAIASISVAIVTARAIAPAPVAPAIRPRLPIAIIAAPPARPAFPVPLVAPSLAPAVGEAGIVRRRCIKPRLLPPAERAIELVHGRAHRPHRLQQGFEP